MVGSKRARKIHDRLDLMHLIKAPTIGGQQLLDPAYSMALINPLSESCENCTAAFKTAGA